MYSFLCLQSVPQKGEESSVMQQTTELGQLVSLHAVGIATHPADESKLVYADETALYSFDKTTGRQRDVISRLTLQMSSADIHGRVLQI